MTDLEFFRRSPLEVAPELLGSVISGNGVKIKIVETEAYLGAEDPASHARSGPTDRCRSMFGPVNRAYVYRSYGMHLCLNVVCHHPESGGAVLIRAGSILEGESVARTRRGKARGLANGPGKLAQCLGIEQSHDGCCLSSGPIKLTRNTSLTSRPPILRGPRIGINVGENLPFRFWFADCPDISRKGEGSPI